MPRSNVPLLVATLIALWFFFSFANIPDPDPDHFRGAAPPEVTAVAPASPSAAAVAAALTDNVVTSNPSAGRPIDHNAIAYKGLAYAIPDPNFSDRKSDVVDTFAEFKNKDVCPLSSLDLHRPFEPLCGTKSDLLEAMSSGGRIGFDAPYMPRGCDMRWYGADEICDILGRFDKIMFIGDSMMRHAVGALHILLRQDLAYGAVTNWNFRADERENCFCQGQFDPEKCALQGIFNSADVLKFDPSSFKCSADVIDIQNHVISTYPPSSEDLQKLGDAIASQTGGRQTAFIYGHGHHNEFEVSATEGWLASIQRTISERIGKGVPWSQLFVTPGASGANIGEAESLKFGTKALQVFEQRMRVLGPEKDVDVLGTWNATIQSTLRDGRHSDIKGNLLKAMMILNWL
ncbi:uncharacterized protein V1510DRAFT_362701, partial [Dipodascopsis tothii]|uniref:uncharacterized protein n=1 Tax=Dipodascopsis tothii TaxID=44089 RepID=UPI0034CF07D4